MSEKKPTWTSLMKQTPQEFFRSQAGSFLFATEAIARLEK